MPRGNEAATLTREQRAEFGDEALNAEELIRANQAAQDPALQRVLKIATDEEKTLEVQSNLGVWSEKFDLTSGEVLMDAAVHGNTVVGVIEGPDGRTRKDYVGLTDDWEPPRLSADEQSRRTAALREQQVQRETARAKADADERIREAEEEIARERDERIARIRAEAEAAVEAETEAAEALVAAAEAPDEEPPATEQEDDEPAEQPEEGAAAEEPSATQPVEPVEAKFPEHHAELDELAMRSGIDIPDGWGDPEKWPIAAKQDFLTGHGVKPGAAQ